MRKTGREWKAPKVYNEGDGGRRSRREGMGTSRGGADTHPLPMSRGVEQSEGS